MAIEIPEPILKIETWHQANDGWIGALYVDDGEAWRSKPTYAKDNARWLVADRLRCALGFLMDGKLGLVGMFEDNGSTRKSDRYHESPTERG